jgi:hypothetical protein
MGENNNVYRLLAGKLERKRPLRRRRCRWGNNISMGLGEVGWGYVDWIGLAWNDLVNAVTSGKLLSGCTAGIPSNSVQLCRVSYDMMFH